MLEDSVEAFVARFRSSAADTTISGRIEGNPLLECLVAGVAIHVFERTGPYLIWSGAARIILNLECDAIERCDPDTAAGEPRIDVIGVSALSLEGVVLERDDPYLVVDAGALFVVGVTGAVTDAQVGERVRVVARPPVHGFVLPRPVTRVAEAPPRDERV